MKTNPSIVLLSGWGFNTTIMQPLIDALENSYPIISIDLHKCIEAHENPNIILENLIHKISPLIPDNSILIGWSLGGIIALKFSELYQEKIKKIICLASSPCFREHEHWPGISNQLWENFTFKLENNALDLSEYFCLLQTQGCDNRKFFYKKLSKFSEKNIYSLLTLKSALDILKEIDLRHLISTLKIPMLYILSNSDKIVPVTIANYLKKYVDIKIIENSAHIPFLTKPEETISTINKFLLC